MTAEASILAAEASALSVYASTLAIEASSLSEAATSTTSFLASHVTSTATLPIITSVSIISTILGAQREASSTGSTVATEQFTTSAFTSTSLSTSLISTDGHAITSVTPVISIGGTTVPVPTNGASSSTISKTNTGGIIGAVIAAVVVLVAIVLVFYRLHIRKKASVKRKRKMFEFGSDYPPGPQSFLVDSLPRPRNSIETRHSRIFSTALSIDPFSDPADFESARQSASTVAATAGENTDFDDEKADLTNLGQPTSSHESVLENTALYRSYTSFSADSDPPPSYRATAIDFTSVLGDS